MATIFDVYGPFDVPYYQGAAGRTITDDNVGEFWESYGDFAKNKGCYVFGIKAGRGYTPAYVGKATKTFKQEGFAAHKLAKYQQFLADYRKGTPILFLVIAPTKRGAPNLTHIKELEEFLIQVALAANPDLLNIKGTEMEEWGIAGVLRGGQGKPAKDAKEFKKIMKM